ncbi:MAG: septum formation initiator family protein [Clostridiales Family XIII bacterium]|jgi:cell division protein FtsB|nr:septum formation initiator family protein [Clostridiales Family XIII bacterium]
MPKNKRNERRKKSEQVIDFEEAREERGQGSVPQAELPPVRGGTPKKRKIRFFAYAKLYILILLVLLLVVTVYGGQILNLKSEEESAVSELEAALDRKARLETELSHIDDPAYIEQQARTRLRMIKPGELLYVLPEAPRGLSDAGAEPPAAEPQETDAGNE